jgi:hypothetical protein
MPSTAETVRVSPVYKRRALTCNRQRVSVLDAADVVDYRAERPYLDECNKRTLRDARARQFDEQRYRVRGFISMHLIS